MTDFNDFKDAAGKIDWRAYKAAQVQAGEICRRCSSYIVSIHRKTAGPQLCGGCVYFDNETGEVEHEELVRCPECEHHWSVHDGDHYSIFQEDGGEVYCPECDCEFHVGCRITYEFTSPALRRHEEDEDDD